MAQIKQLTAELQKIATEELGEVPARIPDDLQALKQWIEQQPHLKANTDDQFLIQFLRGSKYSLEIAKQKIDHFYAIKTKYPELFLLTDVDKAKFRDFHNIGCTLLLPRPLHDCGPRIVLSQLKYSPDEFNFVDFVKHSSAILETVMINDPFACIYGGILLLDGAKTTPGHLPQITPSILKTLLFYYEKSFTLRLRSICIINLSSRAEQILKIALSYVPQKMKDKIFLCSNNSNKLDDHIPKIYLPQEYGGENGSLDEICAEYHQVWDKYRDYFKQNENYGTNEHLRLGKPLVVDSDLGVEGSFRRLEVD